MARKTRSQIYRKLSSVAVDPDALADTLVPLAAEIYSCQNDEAKVVETIRQYIGCDASEDSLMAEVRDIAAVVMS